MIAADLMRSLLALGYQTELHDGRLAVASPEGKLTSELHDRIVEQRDALKALLAASGPLLDVKSADEHLLDVDAHRFSRNRLTTLIAEWLTRYVETGYAPSVEIAAWFAAARDAQDRANMKEPAHGH